MHLMPNDPGDIATIVGIDPGSDTLGLANLSFSISQMQVLSWAAQTFVGSKLPINEWMSNMHSHRFARIDAHRLNLIYAFNFHQPVAIVCESPFFSSKFPQAFGALIETVSGIRQAVWDYDKTIGLDLIDPPSVKKAVGAAGNAGKEEVQSAVVRLLGHCYTGSLPLERLDEHSFDAVAVAYSKFMQFKGK